MEAQAREALASTVFPPSVIVMTVHKFRRNLFFYYESDGAPIDPDMLFLELVPYLEPVPFKDEPRYFAQLMDIFHYHVPGELSAWRKDDIAEPWVRLSYLEPDMYASYIFYHWQLQEERPGDGAKYGIIAMYENLLYFYMERPHIVEPVDYPGKLSTNNTPGDWGTLMGPHFIPWPDTTGDQSVMRWDLELVLNVRHKFG